MIAIDPEGGIAITRHIIVKLDMSRLNAGTGTLDRSQLRLCLAQCLVRISDFLAAIQMYFIAILSAIIVNTGTGDARLIEITANPFDGALLIAGLQSLTLRRGKNFPSFRIILMHSLNRRWLLYRRSFRGRPCRALKYAFHAINFCRLLGPNTGGIRHVSFRIYVNSRDYTALWERPLQHFQHFHVSSGYAVLCSNRGTQPCRVKRNTLLTSARGRRAGRAGGRRIAYDLIK